MLDFTTALAVKSILDRFIAPAVTIWLTAQLFRSKPPALSAEQQKQRAPLEGAELGLIVGVCAVGAAHWWFRAPWDWSVADAPALGILGVAVVGLTGTAGGALLAYLAEKTENALPRAMLAAFGAAGGIAFIAFYLLTESGVHQLLLCGIMAMLFGLRFVRLVEVLK